MGDMLGCDKHEDRLIACGDCHEELEADLASTRTALAEARAEVERLRFLLDQCGTDRATDRGELEDVQAQLRVVVADNDRLRADNERLKAALRKYGRHGKSPDGRFCPVPQGPDAGNCCCGLDTALASLRPKSDGGGE